MKKIFSDAKRYTKNQDSEKNSIPPSPQEPTEPVPEITPVSASVDMPPEAPESSINIDNAVPVNNANPENELVSTQNPLEMKPEESPLSAPLPEEIPPVLSEPMKAPETRTAQIPVIEPLPVITSTKLSQKDLWKRFLDKVQIGKRKKLEKIMTLFLKKSKITNDEVEKFLHVSDATTTRYLSQLEKEGKIKQSGKTGHSVFYSKI